MKLVSLLLAVLVATFAPSAAHASDWWLTSTLNGNSANFVDTSTMVRSGNQVTAWVHTEYRTPREEVAFLKLRIRFDCRQFSFTILQASIFRDNNSVIDTQTMSRTVHASPDSIGMKQVEFACGWPGAASNDEWVQIPTGVSVRDAAAMTFMALDGAAELNDYEVEERPASAI